MLKTDGTGRIVQRIRCALPNSAKFAVGGNPEGFMALGTILVGENTLWLLDAKGFAPGYRVVD